VAACPPSAWYRFRKLARRNRAALTTAIFVGLALVAGTTLSTWQAIRARRAEATARAEADKATAINEFLTKDLLEQAERDKNAEAESLTLLEVVDQAAERVEERFRDRPLLEAALRYSIGRVYMGLSAFDKSRLHLTRALEIYQREKGPEAPETANAMVWLADCFKRTLQPSRAEPLVRRGLDTLRRTLGEGHDDTVIAMIILGVTCRDLGMMAESESVLSEAAEVGRRFLGPEHGSTLCAMADLAYVYAIQGKLSLAEPLAVQAQEVSYRVLGDKSIALWSLDVATRVFEAQGKRSQVEAVAAKLDEIRLARSERAFARSPDQPGNRNELAWCLATCPVQGRRDPARAVELARKAVEKQPNATCWNTLGVALYRLGDWTAAIEALENAEGLAPGQHLAFNGFFLAMAHRQLGQEDKARTWFDRATAWMEQKSPKDRELVRFRAEAAALLDPPQLPADVFARP
jgi:tetratricopeptide (TPR) repeat protein